MLEAKNTPFLYLSNKALNKINEYLFTYPKVEWSGIAFFKVNKTDLIVNSVYLVDIFLKDVGDAVSTEFDSSNCDYFKYAVENNLLDCGFGTIHSHNMMNVFFSGTDEEELEITAQEREHYLSIIVNNRGDIKARITTKYPNKAYTIFLFEKNGTRVEKTIPVTYYQECAIGNIY